MLCLAELDLHTTLTWALGLLVLFTFLCMVPLRLSEERLRREKSRLEGQIVEQQHAAMSARDTAAAWRLDTQRQFDAFRANSSAQLAEVEKRATDLTRQLDETHKQSWQAQAALQASLHNALELAGNAPELRAKVDELEQALVVAIESRASAPLNIPPVPSVSDEREMALQKALQLALFKSRKANSRAKGAASSRLRLRRNRSLV
jgi:hypothetical protein